MPRRSLLALAVAAIALLCPTAPALGFGTGATFLTGGLDLPAGAIAGGRSGYAGSHAARSSVSRYGRYVAFVSEADTLDPAANPDVANVYRKDRATGAVVLVSRADGADGGPAAISSDEPAISADGTRVAFRTAARLVPADADDTTDVYVRDVETGRTTLASVDTTTGVGDFAFSGNGRYVAFATEDELLPADPSGSARWDVYRRDLTTDSTALVSLSTAGTRAGDGASIDPSISDDGSWVAFASQARDIASFTATSGYQVFARDMGRARTYLVSSRVTSASTAANGASTEPVVNGGAVSGNPSSVYLAYTSSATDLDVADVDGFSGVYRRRLSPDTRSTLVSRADGSAGANADSSSYWPSISDDGAYVTFTSQATNLGGSGFATYVRNVGAGGTSLVSEGGGYGARGAIAGDGSLIAWYDGAGVTTDSDPDLGGVFARSYDGVTLDAPTFVSRPASPGAFLATSIAVSPPEPGARTVSADGRYVVFAGANSRLPNGGSVQTQIYRRDTLTGAIDLVSRANGAVGAAADADVFDPSISADGTRIAFASRAHLDPAHAGGSSEVYVRDVAAGTTTLVSRAEGAGGAVAAADALYPAISADGAHVAFVSAAGNLGAPAGLGHAYLRDVAGGHTQLVDRATGAAGAIGDGDATLPAPSGDGRLVVFASEAANLDPADPDRFSDAYVRDTVAGTTTLVSRRSGLSGQHSTRSSYRPAISADGSTVAFETYDQELAPEAGTWPSTPQVVARTLANGANVLVSRSPGGEVANDDAGSASVNGDGSVIAFESNATNLIAGVGGGTRVAVFARAMATGAVTGPPAFGLTENDPQDRASDPSLSDDGQCMAFVARGHNAVTGTAGDSLTTYMYVVAGQCPKPVVETTIAARRSGPRRPTVKKLSLTHKRFRVGRRRTPKVAAGAHVARRAASHRAAAKRKAAHRKASKRRARHRRHRRVPRGTAFRFTLNARANVSIAIERKAPGRLVGRFCRKPRHRLRRHLRCVRNVRVARLARRGMPAGRDRIAFSGRIGRRALKPGSYRARVRASNSAGTSAWRRVTFKVVR